MSASTEHLTPPPTAAVAVPHLPGVAVGCDVVTVARVTSLLRRRPAARTRLFTAAELADSTRDGVGAADPVAMRRLAARFAAKEALAKLLGRPALAWTDVEIVASDDGAPVVHIHGVATDVAVSLSHDDEVAMAVVARRTDQPGPDDLSTTQATQATPTRPATTRS